MKRFRCESLNFCASESMIKPEVIIICEKQEESYCGRHTLRALSQRLDLFSDQYLMEVAQNLAIAEQICRDGQAVPLTQYYYEKTGEYDIQILKAALMNIFKIDIVQIHTLERRIDSVQGLILSNIQHVQAFVIQEDYHYYCLRRFRQTKDFFFIIDSKHPSHHQPIHCDDILNFLGTLLANGSNIYVTVEYISDAVEDQVSADNIETRLWALPDSSADRVCLNVVCEME